MLSLGVPSTRDNSECHHLGSLPLEIIVNAIYIIVNYALSKQFSYVQSDLSLFLPAVQIVLFVY